MQLLSDIRNSKCKLCDLHKSAKTVCVMGTGNVSAKIFFLGESPGEEEDKKGEPFVGRAGNMLDSILKEVDLPREDVFISNVIKCHPPFNSKPAVDKLEMCSSHYLRKELQLVRPDLIVCLGGLAAKVLLQDVNVSVAGLRNTIYYTQGPLVSGIPFIVTYHPAAVFHQPQFLEFIVEDMEWAKRLVSGALPKKKKKTKYVKLDSIWDIPDIRKAKWLDLDTETDALDCFLPDREILSLQLSINEGEGYYFDWTKRIGKQLGLLLRKYSPAINGHNIKHDLRWLRTKAGIIHTGKLNDTIQNLHLLDENFPAKSLDVVATSFTELKGHKQQFTKMIRQYIMTHKEKKEPIRKAMSRMYKQAFYAIPEKIRIAYGVGDADATGRLRRRFRPKLKEAGLIPLHNLMMNVTSMFVDIECNGVKIDERVVAELDKQYSKKITKLRAKLDDLVPPVRKGMNYNSRPQLKHLLYGAWKCTPHEIRQGKKRVRYSTGKDALDLILQDDITKNVKRFIETLKKYGEVTKLHSTYIKGLPYHLRDGFIHANWRLDGTVSGRYSCSDPNLQQIPRTGEVKRMFISRWARGVLMQVDVSQGELRWGAQISNERMMIELFNQGTTDIHRSMAAAVRKKKEEEVTEEERYGTKQCNFAKMYGSGVKTLAQEMGKSEEEALAFIRMWDRTFPDWQVWVDETEKFVIENHYVRNPFGRYRHLFIPDPDSYEAKVMLRQAINSPIQGGLHDYNKVCGYKLWKWLEAKSLNKKSLIVAEVHDSYLLDNQSERVAMEVAKYVKDIFENPDLSEFGIKLKVPMKVDIKIGPNWKEMEDYAG